MKENNQNKSRVTSRIPELEIIDLDEKTIADHPLSDSDGNKSTAQKKAGAKIPNAPIKKSIEEPTEEAAEEWYEEAAEEETEDEEDFEEEESGRKSKLSPLVHIGFLLLIGLILFLGIQRIRNFGTKADLNDFEGNNDAEVLDHMMPLLPPKGLEIVDDGETTIVLFGNSPFADDRDSDTGVASMIADKTGATVYNCSVGDSYLAAQQHTINPDAGRIDAFTFYWLTTAFCLGDANDYIYEWIFEGWGEEAPADAQPAYDLMKSIDYSKVDVIGIMYDGTDYLNGYDMFDDVNDTNIQTFTGNLCAGIDLIQQTYPHIRIIVMSPTYAFAVNEDGEYVSSDQYRYGDEDVLSTYCILQSSYCYDRSVTFVDNIYGTITEDNAEYFLTDNLHLNELGREKVADRFIEALNYFNR